MAVTEIRENFEKNCKGIWQMKERRRKPIKFGIFFFFNCGCTGSPSPGPAAKSIYFTYTEHIKDGKRAYILKENRP